MNSILPEQLHQLFQNGTPIRLLDVRTPAEYRAVHAEYAVNTPLDSLDPATVTRLCNGAAEQPLYVICQSGGRGAKACERLASAGFGCVVNVVGGTSAWEQAGLPVIRGQKTISLERQVRIVAGILVVVGSALGYFVHPYWFGLAAVVGAGLAYAGITDTCGMGMMLAKMPWNQVSTTSHNGSSGK
jgi:rhodanese-related sulfurtransferase